MINNSTSPLVSVQMPCYNARSSLPMAIASLLYQTYENWELIFVDDGSTDGSADFVESVGDKRIKVFRLGRNCGRGPARQKAKDEAGGDYMAMLDADDWYYSYKLEKQVDYMEKNKNIGIISAAMIIVDSKMNAIAYTNSREISGEIKNSYDYKGKVAHAPSMIRIEIAKRVHYELAREGEDQDFLRKILVGAYYSNLPGPLYVYNKDDTYNLKDLHEHYSSQKYLLKKSAQAYSLNKKRQQIKNTFKYMVKRAAFALGMEKHIIALKWEKPSREMLEKYEHEKNKVLKIADELKGR